MKLRYFIFFAICLFAALIIWHLHRSPLNHSLDEDTVVISTSPPPSLSRGTEPAAAQQPPHELAAPYSPPKVHDPQLAALVDRNAANRITSDISARLPRVKNKDDFPALLSVLSDSRDDDTARNEVANLLRRSNCPELLDTLMKTLDNPAEKPRFRAFVMQHLGQLVPDEQVDPDGQQKLIIRFRQALEDKDVSVRRQALQNLCQINDTKGKETAIAWLKANDDTVRDSAIHCIFNLDLREYMPIIRQYARDKNEVIRIAAIVTLSQWSDEESRAAFEEAAQSSIARIQRAGQAALKRLEK